MAVPSSSDINEYYKWKFIGYIAVAVGFFFWLHFLSKKYGFMGFLVLMVIIFGGIMYFQYKAGYTPWYYRAWLPQ
jgi:hypothetical protein